MMYMYFFILVVYCLFDYVEEGGNDVKVIVIKNKIDLKIVWFFYFGWYNLFFCLGEKICMFFGFFF